MYRLLLVDDEEIERKGMAELIPWNEYDVELIGTAQNGQEGLVLINAYRPDIVITDVKMPVMDGIEMIEKAQKMYRDISYIVLSGYGEYEYTSRAMEEGVKHYILKPSDEMKIAKVLQDVKAEIAAKRQKADEENKYKRTVHRLLPKAKEQIFRNILIDHANVKDEYMYFLDEMESTMHNYYMMAFRTEGGFNTIEQFSLGNIFHELMGEENVVLSTHIEDQMIFLLKEETRNIVKDMYDRAGEVYREIFTMELQAAISESGKIETAGEMYKRIQELFRMGEVENLSGLLSDDLFQNLNDGMPHILAYTQLKESKDFEEILFEMVIAFQKMDLLEYTLNQKMKMCEVMLKLMFHISPEENQNFLTSWTYMEYVVGQIVSEKKLGAKDEEEKRRRLILQAIYQNIQNPELNIQYLAKEVFFMNVDYFGRKFTKLFDMKFTDFLVDRRIKMSQQLMQFDIKLKTADLAELVGYAADGQYFYKAFKKVTGMTPAEYKESLV
ncbi:MAG: response regulator [Lachnospira sp.]|nr:response regulator [Lachnospira sp.]